MKSQTVLAPVAVVGLAAVVLVATYHPRISATQGPAARAGEPLPSAPVPAPVRFTCSYCAEHVQLAEARKRLHPFIQLLRRFTRPALLLDIGANRGVVSLPVLGCLNQPHRVISIEPVKNNLATLEANAARLGFLPETLRWNLSRTAFSNVTGETVVYVPGKNGREFGDNTSPNKAASTDGVGGVAIPESIRLEVGDDYLRRLAAEPELIKIDTQGSEIKVVTGLKDYLSSNRDLLVHSEQCNPLIVAAGEDVLGVYKFMKGLGFKVYCNPRIFISNQTFAISEREREYTADEVVRKPKHVCGDLTYWKRKVWTEPKSSSSYCCG